MSYRTLWKFPFILADETFVTVPDSAEFRSVGLDATNKPALWFEVGDTPLRELKFQNTHPFRVFVVGTGNRIPEDARKYLGSFVQSYFVWHIYTS